MQRGNVSLSTFQVWNVILYVAENGCKWRALRKRFGNWYTIYTRMNRWSKNGVLDRVSERKTLGVSSRSGPVVRAHAVGPRQSWQHSRTDGRRYERQEVLTHPRIRRIVVAGDQNDCRLVRAHDAGTSQVEPPAAADVDPHCRVVRHTERRERRE